MMQGAGMTIGIASCVGAIFTLVSGTFYGFEYGIRYGLIAGLIAGVVVGVVGVLASLLHHAWSPALLATTRLFRPNEGMHRSLLNAILVGFLFAPVSGLISGITCGVAFGVLGHLESWPILGIGFAIIFGLYIGFQFAMIHGGIAWLSHYLLRLFLWNAGVAPLNVVPFLDDAVEHVILRKLGGGYMFSHRVLLDYFASVSGEEEDSSSSPDLSS
jgi:hypothetical protein